MTAPDAPTPAPAAGSAAPSPTAGLAMLAAERAAFRRRVLRTSGALVAVLGSIFVLSEFGDQGLIHNAILIAMAAFGLITVALTRMDRLDAAIYALFFGVVPTVGWIHVVGERAQMSVMYLVPLLVVGMVVSPRRVAMGLSVAAALAALTVRVLRWALVEGQAVQADLGAWLTPTFDAVAVLVVTAAMVRLGLGRTERNESILRDALDDRERLAEAARTASDEKSAFLARVSHELRTPLNAILGYTELVQEEGQISQDATEDLERVHASARQLLALIDSVLDLSKVEAAGWSCTSQRSPWNACSRPYAPPSFPW